MPNLAERLILAQSDEAHIKSSIRLMRIFLMCIALLSLYTFGLHYFFYAQTTTAFNTWIVSTCVFLLGSGILAHVFARKSIVNVQFVDRYMLIVCGTVGMLLAFGVYLIHFDFSAYNVKLDKIHVLTLSTLLSVIAAAISLAFLTLRLRYFFCLCTPIVLPVFAAQFTAWAKPHLLFYLAYDFAVLVMAICAFEAHRNHLRRSNLFFKNQELIKHAEQQVQWTDELCQQLQNEMNKSKQIEMELQLHNQLLEQKVKERTFDIQKMNERLEHHSQNLALAHETAGIRAWNWDIANRRIEMSSGTQHEKTIDNWQQHRLALEKAIHPNDLAAAKRALYQHLRGFSPRFEATVRIKGEHDEWRWVQDLGRVVSRDPKTKKPLRMVGMRRDIHQEKQDQEQLKLAASVVEQAAEGIFILDENLCYVDVNPYFEQMTGLNRDTILQRHLFDISREAQQQSYNITQLLIQQGSFDGELHQHYTSGREVDMWLHINAVKDEQSRVIKYIGIVSDHSERKRQEQRLSYLQNYDRLTDLPNRMYYHEQLHQVLVSAGQQQFAVIRLNIDRFRQLNEVLTKQGADTLLQQVAQRLRRVCQDVRLLAYLNGDDFAILYDISHLRSSVKQICERIFLSMMQPFQIEVHEQNHSQNQPQIHEQSISLSMGIAYYPEHGRQIDSLNNRAELALSEAKRLGGNTICDYAHEQHVPQHEADLEHELRKAIQNHELVVFYQPKLNAQTEKIMGFEALVRWNHPRKGILAPDYFIPVALESSLISDIGRLVIHQTAQQIQAWNLAGFPDISVSVNIVAQQIHRGELLIDLEQAMQKYPIAGKALELEITESSLIDNSQLVKDMLSEVKRRNISISLDDFGTGYSSLAYLTEFPIDILKIDRSFIGKIGDPKQDAIISAMIAMGKAMGLTLVAEGVETEAQAAFLKHLDCDILQGYLFSKPLNAKMSTEFLQNHQQLLS